MMGICSLFGLSRGLSVSSEVVRMLLMGKKGKPAGRSLEQAPLAGSPFGASALRTKRRQRCWGLLGFHQRDIFRLSGQEVGLGLSARRKARRRRAKSGLDYEIRKQVTRCGLTVCLVVRKRLWSWHHLHGGDE
jgi:hypothetical protein